MTASDASRAQRLFALPASRRGRWVCLGLWIVLIMAFSPLASKFEKAQKNDVASFLPRGTESLVVAEQLSKLPRGESASALVVVRNPRGLGAQGRAGSQALAQQLKRAGLRDLQGIDGPRFSRDGTTALINVAISFDPRRSNDAKGLLDTVEQIRELTKSAEAAGSERAVGGELGGVADAITIFKKINGVLLYATAGLVIFLLLLIYRSPIFWLFPMISIGVAEFVARGMGYALAQLGLTVSGQSAGILSVLVFGAGTDYALLLVSRYREELRRHQDPLTAMQESLRRAGVTIGASALTVIAALLCLTLADVGGTRGLGPIGSFGVLVAAVSVLTFLPPLLLLGASVKRAEGLVATVLRAARYALIAAAVTIPPDILISQGGLLLKGGDSARVVPIVISTTLGAAAVTFLATLGSRYWRPRYAFWPIIPSFGGYGSDETHGLWRKVGETVSRRPRTVAALSTALLLVFCLGFLGYNTDLDSGNAFRGEVESVKAQKLLAQAFPSGLSQPTQVFVERGGDIAATVKILKSNPAVAQVSPPLPGPEGVLLAAVLRPAPFSPLAYDAVRDLRRQIQAAGLEGVAVGGPSAQEYDLRTASARDNKVVIPIVLFVVFLILIALLRALVLPLMLIATVVLSFFASFGATIFVSEKIFGFPGMGSGIILYAFVFLVALGIDYNIFLAHRAREEALNFGTRTGMIRALAVTGTVITSAGIVLAGTFSILGILPIIFLTELGFAIAFGVLLDTMVVRSLLVPALVFITGSKVWWPSALVAHSEDSDLADDASPSSPAPAGDNEKY